MDLIRFEDDDFNPGTGGIAGLQEGGEIYNCVSNSVIWCSNDATGSIELQPCIGQIVGLNETGICGGNILYGYVSKGSLTTVAGHNQALYVKNGEIGRG